jgi:hypothetical protein
MIKLKNKGNRMQEIEIMTTGILETKDQAIN